MPCLLRTRAAFAPAQVRLGVDTLLLLLRGHCSRAAAACAASATSLVDEMLLAPLEGRTGRSWPPIAALSAQVSNVV
jgi:hypothetical protein